MFQVLGKKWIGLKIRVNMKDYVETNHGKAYFKNNLRHGDKLEISSWMNTIREQLASCMNTGYRSADYDEDHQKLYLKTFKELKELQETINKTEILLEEYLDKKK